MLVVVVWVGGVGSVIVSTLLLSYAQCLDKNRSSLFVFLSTEDETRATDRETSCF